MITILTVDVDQELLSGDGRDAVVGLAHVLAHVDSVDAGDVEGGANSIAHCKF